MCVLHAVFFLSSGTGSNDIVFLDLKPLTAKYVYQIWQKEWAETGLVCNKFHEILPKLPDKLLSFCNTRKENTVLNRLHTGHSYLTHSFILRREEAPVCVACGAVITVKHIFLKRDLCIHSFGT